jgi:membrane fusion protein, copper/silver efflux system
MAVRYWFFGVAGLIATAGCGGSSSNPAPKQAGADQAEITATLAKLPAVDKTLAEAQKICPITGEPLGSMGVPPKLTLKGETVFLCCLACKGDAEADPEKTLKTVGATKAKGK